MENERLHCDDGPALLFRDGWAVYAYHGTGVAKNVIEDPLSITVGQILDEKNTYIRSILMDRCCLSTKVLVALANPQLSSVGK